MGIILGIDPGFCITGYGLIHQQRSKLTYLASGVIRVGKKTLTVQLRLQNIFHDIQEVVSQYRPDEVAIEKIFMNQNPQSALKLGQARGVAMLASTLTGIPISEYSPRQVKQAMVGYGAATKRQMQQMVCSLLQLSKLPPEDAADALAIAICHAHTHKTLHYQLKEINHDRTY
jgi:crossover junction endodeoxyribonuclease RuvC